MAPLLRYHYGRLIAMNTGIVLYLPCRQFQFEGSFLASNLALPGEFPEDYPIEPKVLSSALQAGGWEIQIGCQNPT